MSVFGAQGGLYHGTNPSLDYVLRIGPSTRTLTVLFGTAFRFLPNSTKDIAAVWLNWNTAGTTPAFTLTIETDSAGLPSGSLYDAAATLAVSSLSAGWVRHAFASLPTAGLTAGTPYHVVLVGGASGAAPTQIHAISDSSYPWAVLTTATAATRSSFVEATSASPICAFEMEDGTIETLGCSPFVRVVGGSTTRWYENSGATIGSGSRIIIRSPTYVRGMNFPGAGKSGTPIQVRGRIYDSSGAVVATTPTVPYNLFSAIIGAMTTTRISLPINTPVLLTPGTYYALFDQAGSGDASNYWQPYFASTPDVACVPQDNVLASVPDVDSWTAPTVTTTTFGGVSLITDSRLFGGYSRGRIVNHA